jgi:hypothetical protein
MGLSDVGSVGELKQLILRLYNSTNQAVWGTGVQQQRVEILGDRILVVAVHQRVPALAALDPTRRDLTRQVDVALVDLYKSVFAAELERELGVGVRAVLKDYDPDTQLSCTVVVLDQPVGVPASH